jgi:hypothetical protein
MNVSARPYDTSLRTQNMKTGADALGTAENESGSAKHEHRTAFGMSENESGSAK